MSSVEERWQERLTAARAKMSSAIKPEVLAERYGAETEAEIRELTNQAVKEMIRADGGMVTLDDLDEAERKLDEAGDYELATDGGRARIPDRACEWVEGYLDRLDMVEWDRFTAARYDGNLNVTVYGWIDRDDEYKDFVVVRFWPEHGENGHLGFTTSSDEYSQEIHNRLFGEDDGSGHNECRRVENTFDVEHAVELTDQEVLTDGGQPVDGTKRSGGLERFAVERALYAAWTTEFWIPADPDYGYVDYFEAAAIRNLGLLRGFEELAEDIDRRGIIAQTDRDQAKLVTDGGQSADGTDWSPNPEITELIDGEKPDWTDPTSCPYPDCDTRTGELRMEYHLSQEHGWCLIETDFESESLVDDRDVDDGEQVTLPAATDGGNRRSVGADTDGDLRTDGGEDEVETDHEIRCYHCERVVDRRSVSMIRTPIDHDEGLGYDMVPVPWCRSCQLEIHGHECDRCGRRHMNLEDALLCCDRELGPVPAGGERNV